MYEIVLAMDEDGLIGINNKLPWNIPEELQFFKRLTTRNVVIMGRKTYDSIGKPLPNRENIIITKDTRRELGKKFHELVSQGIFDEDLGELGLKLLEEEKLGIRRILIEKVKTYIEIGNRMGKRVFIIGGKSIYEHFLPEANILHISTINGQFKTNTDEDVFMNIDLKPWELVKEEDRGRYIYKKYIRRKNG